MHHSFFLKYLLFNAPMPMSVLIKNSSIEVDKIMLLVFSILKFPFYLMPFSLKWKIWLIEWNFKKGHNWNTYMHTRGEYQHQNMNNKMVTAHRVHLDVNMCISLYAEIALVFSFRNLHRACGFDLARFRPKPSMFM